MSKNIFSTIEVAKVLGISRQAVLKKIKSGAIKAKKIGRNFVIAKEELPLFLGETLSKEKKEGIEKAVQKVVNEYGETLKLLGRE